MLGDVLGFHPQAVDDCTRRNPAPKLHVYPDHAFVVLHPPELGAGGHVHTIELDLFVSRSMLVTVHGPLNPALDQEVALVVPAMAEAQKEGWW